MQNAGSVSAQPDIVARVVRYIAAHENETLTARTIAAAIKAEPEQVLECVASMARARGYFTSALPFAADAPISRGLFGMR